MKFRKQLGPHSIGNYETNLIWKENHPPLRSNKVNNLWRLHSLRKNWISSNKLGKYNKIIQEQINEGIIEKVNETKIPQKGKELYLPHRRVIQESAETTEKTIFFDASAKPSKDSVSLSEFMETRSPLQNSLWDIHIRTRFCPILWCEDKEKTSQQIRIWLSEWDALRLHCLKNCDPKVIEIELEVLYSAPPSHFSYLTLP